MLKGKQQFNNNYAKNALEDRDFKCERLSFSIFNPLSVNFKGLIMIIINFVASCTFFFFRIFYFQQKKSIYSRRLSSCFCIID